MSDAPLRHVVNYQLNGDWKQEEYISEAAASKRLFELKAAGNKTAYCVTFPVK